MKHKKINVFAMRCLEQKVFKGKMETIENTLKEEQQFVQGLITVIGLTEELDIVANDEGKLDRLPFNRVWLDRNGTILDILVGNIFVCRHDDDGNFTNILESDIPFILSRLPAIAEIQEGKILLQREEHLPDFK